MRDERSGKGLKVAIASALMFGIGYFASVGVGASQPPGPSALADVPGLGRDDAGEQRDDTIALYEAYLSQLEVSQCMRGAGHIYRPELAFPAEVAVAVARGIGIEEPDVTATPGPSDPELAPSGRVSNGRYVEALSRAGRDSYYSALYGERLEDVELVAETGQLPDGRDDFATDGCAGKASTPRDGIYAIRSRVNETARQARLGMHEDAKLGCAVPGFDAVDSMEDYEEGLSDLVDRFGADAVDACGNELAARLLEISRAADDIAAEAHGVEIEDHQRLYEGALEAVQANPRFRAFLASEYPAAVEMAEIVATSADE